MPIPKGELNLGRVSAKDMIYEHVKNWIIEGKLLPLEKISDVEIAEYFSVSRTPVREAFKLLEMQRLIQSFPGRSTIVTEIQTDNIEECYLPLAELQRLAVTLAVEKITESDIERLRTLNEKFKAEASGDDPMRILNADIEFHGYILEIAGNQYIMDFSDTLISHILRLEYKLFKDIGYMEESVREHEKIIEAFEMRDGFTASLIMKNNWNRSLMKVKSLIESYTE